MKIVPFVTHGEFYFSPFIASMVMEKNPIPTSSQMRITSILAYIKIAKEGAKQVRTYKFV